MLPGGAYGGRRRDGLAGKLICDSGERYANSYYSDAWLDANGLDPAPFEPKIEVFLQGGKLDLELEESLG